MKTDVAVASNGVASDANAMRARFLRSYWAAAASSCVVLLSIFLFYRTGYLAETGFRIVSGGILFLCVFYYALFRSGLNFRAADPSLTVAQVLSATLVLMIAMFHTVAGARSALLPFVLMTFVFGVFRLPIHKLIWTALTIIAGYAVMIAALLHYRPQDVDLRLEIPHLAVFGIVLLWFSVTGNYVNRLRKKLIASKVAIEELATRDPLTGVHNRRHLSSMLRQEKLRSDRSGESFCIAILDLDFFKKINDTFGHQAGDDVLKACAECGSRTIRPIDCFGRYGGEEFEVLLVQTGLDGARIVAERMRHAIAGLRFPHISSDLVVTVSIGLAQYRPREDIEAVRKRADAALYRAKAGGRNRVEGEAEDVEKRIA